MTKTEILESALSDFVTIAEAARASSVHPATVRRAFDRGLLEGVRSPVLGRLVLRTAAERWAAARTMERRAA